MKCIISLIVSIWILFYSLPLFSQTVTIDHKTQRFLGTVSDLDRSRFFTIHANGNDPDFATFMNDYNVSPGRQFWGPFSPGVAPNATNGNYPAYQNGPTGVRNVSNYVATHHPKNVLRWNLNKTTAANWVVEYFKDFTTSPPKYFEPMNEPFVHAGDAVFSAQQPNQALMRRRMAEWFGEIGKKIHADPALANMKVIGYSSAWPSMERSNFGHWNDRMKMFMDVAGADMDAFSTHLYDGLNVTGQSNFRSGSNSEAILDLIETYSFIKWGTVKDHAITEYGGIESGYPSGYNDIKHVQSVRSINHIIFNLLERENNMAISIPFITGKATWHINAQNNYQPYGAVLFRPTNLGQPNPTGWVYTPRIHFYELWKEVKGKRVHATVDNPDIQVQAFVDNNKIYIALNNLDSDNQIVKLNFIKGLNQLQSIQKKSLKIYPNQLPVFNNQSYTTSPEKVTLIEGETVVLEYTFSQNILFDNTIRSKKYYTNKYLQDINANAPISFAFNGVSTGTGKATLRMAIGRYHNNNSTGVSKRPVVKINGTTVATPSNWKGYDQASRMDFFGTIEIPVPMHLIQANNVVSITFPDNGGKVASMILQVEKYDNAVPDQSAYPTGVAHTVPGIVECENYDIGGQNKAYYDADAVNSGASVSNYRMTESVDISSPSTTNPPLYAVGWTRVGEWLEYTIDVAQTGRYQAEIRYAAGTTNAGQIYMAFNGEKTDLIDLPSTGSWATFNTISETVTLSAGLQVLRVHISKAGLDLDKISFSLLPPANESISLINPPISIPSNTSMTFEVAYDAPVTRDLVVQFWSSTSWLGQATVSVPAGQGTRNVTVNLTSAPTPGAGYIIKADIRPTGGNWTTALDSDNAHNRTVTAPQMPYSGTAHSIPGSVEAEHYDLGGEGIAYHDLTAGNSGNQLRTDRVDIQTTGDNYGAYNIGWIATDEWLEYTINCSTSANYDLYMRVASPTSTAKYKVLIDGVDKTGLIDVPNTGNWQTYQTVQTSNLAISAGTHIVRIQAVSGGFNFNDWAMWSASPVARNITPTTTINESKEFTIYPNPTNKKFINVEFPKLKEKAILQIFSVQGKLVKETFLTSPYRRIDLGDIHNGLYLIKITEGTYNSTKKLIIQE